MRISAFVVAIALIAGTFSKLDAQNNSTLSPYTRYGIGDLSHRSTSMSRSMGGIGIGVRNSQMINPLNPASYTSVDSLTFIFDLGFSATASTMQEAGKMESRWLGNFDYLTLLFPLGRYAALSAGVLPYASVGYNYGFNEKISGASEDTYQKRFSGTGNLSNAYLGLAVRPIRWWSLGVNAQYLFGSIDHLRRVTYTHSSSDNIRFDDNLSLKGFSVELGTQLYFPVGADNQLVLGATFAPRMGISSQRVLTQMIERSQKTPALVSSDTVKSSSDYSLPETYGLGISFSKNNKLMLGADVSYSRWAAALWDHLSEYKAEDTWKVRLGGSYTPEQRSFSYWKKMQYRMGASWENSYISFLNATNEQVRYNKWGVSLGVTFPLVDRRSSLDLSVEYNRLQPNRQGTLAENYFHISVGLRFNEGWFKKIKLD